MGHVAESLRRRMVARTKAPTGIPSSAVCSRPPPPCMGPPPPGKGFMSVLTCSMSQELVKLLPVASGGVPEMGACMNPARKEEPGLMAIAQVQDTIACRQMLLQLAAWLPAMMEPLCASQALYMQVAGACPLEELWLLRVVVIVWLARLIPNTFISQHLAHHTRLLSIRKRGLIKPRAGEAKSKRYVSS